MNQPARHRALDLVVLDIAGTTIDEGSVVYRALEAAVAERDVHPGPAELDAVKGMDKVAAIRSLLTDGGAHASPEVVEATFERFTALLREGYAATPPKLMAGVENVLDHLRADGIKVALTTGFTREVADSVLTAAGWGDDRCDVLVTTDDVPVGRPAPFMIHAAMHLTGCEDVRRVASVGDTVVDIRSARNAGVVAVGVRSGDSDEASLLAEGPDHLLDSAADLYDIDELA